MTLYFVTIGERSIEVEIGADGVRVAGEPVQAELLTLPGTGVRSLDVDGRSHRLVAARKGKGEWDLHLNGSGMTARVLDERARKIAAMAAVSQGPKGPKPVSAPMPGMIMKVEVAVGDEVAAGQGVVIIEAMKMENELKADGAGTVKAVRVTAGQAVEKGTVLIEFE